MIIKIFYIPFFFLYDIFEAWSKFYTHGTSVSGRASSQVLACHTWGVATVLDAAG